MTTQPDRFSTGRNDLVFLPRESAADRAAAFMQPFDVDPAGGIAFDRLGYPVSITPAWTHGLDRFAASELKRVGRAIAAPTEIRQLWKAALDGSKLYTRRYIANIDGIDVAADVNRAGWSFATSEDPGFELDQLKTGTIAWSAD